MTRQSDSAESGPPAGGERHDFERSFDALDAVFAFVQPLLAAHGVDASEAYAIEMTIEEFFTNMVKYNASGSGRLGVELHCGADAVTCRLTDPDSDRWDPTAAPDANLDLPVAQRRPGGLGIHLVRRLVDSIEYEYVGRCSRITFRKTLNGALGTPAAGGSDEH